MKRVFYFIIIFILLSSFEKLEVEVQENLRNRSLEEIFPIESIQSVKIRNINGKHLLTTKELKHLKDCLKAAKPFGGLTEKPGHIFLEIKLKENKVVHLGYVYASKQIIHFENGIDKNDQEFSGSYRMPKGFNFDSYK
jgi:hypothetical protein